MPYLRFRMTAVLTTVLVWMPNVLAAQSLRGVTRDAETLQPIAQVVITVKDSTGSVRGRLFTRADGTFDIGLRPGSYILTTDHIAFKSTTERIVLSGYTQHELRLQPQAVTLEAVEARDNSRCATAGDASAARLWDAARAALGSVAVSSAQREFTVRRERRLRDLAFKQVGEEETEVFIINNKRGYTAFPADVLTTAGFVSGGDNSPDRQFYGPDAELLLSHRFADTHCFGVERRRDRPGHVALTFRPNKHAPKHDIEGALWLDEQTGKLRFVEFFYTGLDGRWDRKYAGGRVDFEQMPDEMWIVRGWRIHLPWMTNLGVNTTKGGVRLTGVSEEGAQVILVDGADPWRK